MAKAEILAAYDAAQTGKLILPTSSLVNMIHRGKTRPNSVSVEDALYGDSGKGSVVAKVINALRAGERKVVSLRWNGGANAGHETKINGQEITTSQLPTAAIFENAVAIMSRGMLIHTNDLLTEIENVSTKLKSKLPGQLIIDEAAILGEDIHRAWETVLNSQFTGGQGSTNKGIATGYMSHYGRYEVTVRDLIASDWETTFRKQYQFYQTQIEGYQGEREKDDGTKEIFNFHLADINVSTLVKTPDGKNRSELRKVGTEDEFIERLKTTREGIRPYVAKSEEVHEVLDTAWKSKNVAIAVEGAQGIGLDPWHGVGPDYTASRPSSRNLNDSTYNIILPEHIRVRGAAMKAEFMSSVGKRVLPKVQFVGREKWEHETRERNDEYGRVTQRPRGILDQSIPLLQEYKKGAGFDYLFVTHMDTARTGQIFRVITHYTYKGTDKEAPLLPYQLHMDKLEAHAVEFEGWDTEAILKGVPPSEWDPRALSYLAFLSATVAPVVMTTHGADLPDYNSWAKGI